MLRVVVRLTVATFVVAVVGLASSPPTQAATCGGGSGVSVVVDFHQLGGGVQSFCDVDGAGENASTQFGDAGHELTYVAGEPFVCRVDTKPESTCARTPPPNAYWSVWWSDGKSGEWNYSSAGVTSLKVPDGGSVALSWQGQSSQAKPRVSPPGGHASGSPSPSPTKHPGSSPRPSGGPGQAPPSAPGSTRSTSAAPSASPSKTAGHSTSTKRVDPSKAGKAQGKSSHGPDETQAGEPSSEVLTGSGGTGSSGSGGLPAWVAPLAITVLFVGAGTIALVRRRGSGSR